MMRSVKNMKTVEELKHDAMEHYLQALLLLRAVRREITKMDKAFAETPALLRKQI